MRQPKTEAEWDAYLAARDHKRAAAKPAADHWFFRATDIPKTERQWDKYMRVRDRLLGREEVSP